MEWQGTGRPGQVQRLHQMHPGCGGVEPSLNQLGTGIITVEELVPIVIAAAVWGSEWKGKTVKAWCDNTAVVSIVNHGSSRNKEAMHLARCLAFITAKGEFEMIAAHIRGTDNTQVDALSRDNLRSLHPQAAREPTAIPEALIDLLMVSRPDWTTVEFYFLNGLSESTRKSYVSAKRCFLAFCASKGTHTLPASESQLCQFVSSLAKNDHLSHSTIKCYLGQI